MKVPEVTACTTSELEYIKAKYRYLNHGECNVSLRATLEGLVKHTTDISVEKLKRADKTLLSVQESMRATNANLTLARARLKQIHAELEKANCGSALPTVKIK
ncbi:unnamed protein product [Parnassius apollo]|uniref:(apollo) hypothetical protein n=1 Tax=Parnassius apollo TaxID=110799 RepID=A0A8S3WA58_PARAO|nr:unnamed protein product [Parnassius apollo]